MITGGEALGRQTVQATHIDFANGDVGSGELRFLDSRTSSD
jgi:hypothetical protein